MPPSLFDVLLAATPPLIVLVLMVRFRWGGAKAGTAGWVAALIIAALRFGAGVDVLFWAHVKSLFLTADVAYIIWAALLLYFVVHHAGALQVIANWFTGLTGDEVLRVLLLGWVFTSFLQGVGGFGVPVAIVAPILVGLGLSPLIAVVVPSIGHAWAVTFGSLGSSYIALVGVTGIDPDLATAPTAILLGSASFGCGLLVAYVYAGWNGVKRAWPAVLLIGLVMAVVQYIIATNGLWNIGSASGSLAGLVVGLWITRWPFYRRVKSKSPEERSSVDDAPEESENRPVPSFPMAIAGYAMLVVLAVLITGVPAVKESPVAQFKLAVSIPETRTSVAEPDRGLKLFGHTGSVLLYSAMIAFVLYKRRGFFKQGAEREILEGVRKKGLKAALGVLAMMCMAMVMANSGMTHTLAKWLSQAVSPGLYAFVSTAIGGLGAFMTGSNTNSNAVFGGLQRDTAALMTLSVPMVLATQTASAAIASLLAPAKIIVGASTVGMSGDEGTVLRNLLIYGGALLLLIAVLSFVFLQAGY